MAILAIVLLFFFIKVYNNTINYEEQIKKLTNELITATTNTERQKMEIKNYEKIVISMKKKNKDEETLKQKHLSNIHLSVKINNMSVKEQIKLINNIFTHQRA